MATPPALPSSIPSCCGISSSKRCATLYTYEAPLEGPSTGVWTQTDEQPVCFLPDGSENLWFFNVSGVSPDAVLVATYLSTDGLTPCNDISDCGSPQTNPGNPTVTCNITGQYQCDGVSWNLVGLSIDSCGYTDGISNFPCPVSCFSWTESDPNNWSYLSCAGLDGYVWDQVTGCTSDQYIPDGDPPSPCPP